MKRLQKKLTADCLFTFNNNLYKQINGCAMGNPLSVILASIFMAKLERDVDDLFLRNRKEEQNALIMKLNTYHHKIVLP